MKKFALGLIVALALGLAFVSSTEAQQSDIQIVELVCSEERGLVVIENLGEAEQDLSGWQLQVGSEAVALRGILQPSKSTAIELAVRDGARLVNQAGVVIHQRDCSGEAAPAITPPTEIPEGGGPPPSGIVLSPVVMMAAGGSMLAAAVATFTLPWLRSTPALPGDVRAGGRPKTPGRLAPGLAFLGIAAVVVLLASRGRGRLQRQIKR